jgi:hypothetical protein
MELEELKKVWTSLDDRLNKQKNLEKSVIKEMIYSKSNKSLSKLLNFEVLGLVIILLVMPLLMFVYNVNINLLALKVCVYGFFVLFIAIVIWQLIKIVGLMKVDFMKSISHNSLLISKYNILIKKEKIAMIFIGIATSLLCIWVYASLHVNTTYWVFLTCMLLIGAFLSYYLYKKVYDKHIDSIRKGLEEMKELEESDEESC